MFTSCAADAVMTLLGLRASNRVTTDVTSTTTWYAPTATVFNGSGHKHAARRTLS